MKNIILSLLLFFSMTTVSCAAINKVVFFGDSLSDDGNLYSLMLHVMPKSPPYYQGRFSNGPTWAEYVGQYLENHFSITHKNYAYGGATAIYHPPSTKFATLVTLNMELDQYYLDSVFQDKSKTLFVIWIGDNDYMFDQDADPESATGKVVAAVAAGMQSLYDHGAKHFMLISLVDASRTPLVRTTGEPEKLRHLIDVHNQKLTWAIAAFTNKHPDADMFMININSLFTDFINDPAKYNEKFHVNITNTLDACWTGGFFLQTPLSNDVVMRDLTKQSLFGNDNTDAAATALARAITSNPELAMTYALGKSVADGNQPCPNPDNYLFWDDIHPTTTMHKIIAQVIESKL